MPGRIDTGTELFIGPAGWSYRDWEAIVYPPGNRTDRLLWIASLTDCIELNSSFYRAPSSRSVEGWAKRLARLQRFRLCIKVLGRFTHERQAAGDEIPHFIHAFDPLLERDLAGPFLLQFPWSFRNTPAARDWIARLAVDFGAYETAVELRHGSWDTPDTLELLASHGLAFCNIDQPVIGDSFPPAAHLTSAATGYIRLHGRNYRDWFRAGAGRDARYDYCYEPREIEAWVGRVREMLGRVRRLFIITNNHYRGQALANAFQIRSVLENRKVAAPSSLIAAYPWLADYAYSAPSDPRHLF